VEGTIRRAAELLKMKLNEEGLFDKERKRTLLYPPSKVGLITSIESAAYVDFIKILNARWAGLEIECIDIQVQGLSAPDQIVAAIDYFNQKSIPPDVLVLTRGGGSSDDLYAFNTEHVTRAVASSRVPILVAIGHERDISLAEMVADQRASTPSNAAEILVPDKDEILRQIELLSAHFYNQLCSIARQSRQQLQNYEVNLDRSLIIVIRHCQAQLTSQFQLIEALNPRLILKRGFSIVRLANTKSIVKAKSDVQIDDIVDIELAAGHIKASVQKI
jgi:exodeoxyribonuclease VII large subunit